MSIKHAIAHQLVCASESTLTLRPDLYSVDDSLNTLLAQIKSAFFNRASKQYGQFDNANGTVKTLLEQWSSQDLSFAELTVQWLKQLKLAIEQDEQETEGYWFFAEEETEQDRLLWFFQLKHKHGIKLNKSIDIEASSVIDFAKLGFGGCIDLAAFAQQEQKYLTISFGVGDRALQSSLVNFLDFVDTVNTAEDTERFLEIVKAYSQSLPQEAGGNYRKKALEYCAEQDKLGELVVADEMAEVIKDQVPSQAEQSLTDFIETEQPELKKEFIPNRSALKKFQRYTGKTKEVSISFSNENLGKTIQFDPDNETLTITHLPPSLVKQLHSALRDNEG